MIRRAIAGALAAGALAWAPAAGASVELNVIPSGQQEPGASWAALPGIMPAATQALMYDRLTPLGRNVTDAVLQPSADGTGYFKSARLLGADDPSLLTDETVTAQAGGRTLSARIRRDAYGVPHVFSASDDGVLFAAGYVTAQDRSLVLDQTRFNGLAAAIGIPGTPVIRLVLGLYDYRPSARVVREVTRQQTAALRAAGPEGRRVLHDIDTYLAGINLWYARNRPGFTRFTRTDVYALNAIKAEFLGEGGGQEVENALFLDAARDRLGARRGTQAYVDLRRRDDPASSTTTTRRAPWQPRVPVRGARGLVRLEQGSFRSAAPVLPDAAAAAAIPGRREASNALLVSGRRSATGRPLFVGGPQLGYEYPGLTLEMDLSGPHIHVRGATAPPFPGYMLIGRGTDFAWTLTSAGADVIDTYAERLCGGSRTRYRYRGRCRPMDRLDAGTIAKNGRRVRVVFDRTVHGPVIGYAREAGTRRLVALARKRAEAGRETTDQLLYRRLTFGRVHSARAFIRAAAATPQTFNSFYASRSEIAFVTTGRLPLRPRGVNPDLPVDGGGAFEWRGFLPAARHPQAIDPPSGLLVSWNNKPAPGFPAGDDRWSEGSVVRDDLLLRELARVPRHTLATVLGAANAAATEDPRALMWPTVAAVLARARPPSAVAQATAAEIGRWAAGGGSWVDANGDGAIDDPGVAAIGAVWDRLAGAALCGRLGARVCAELETRAPRFEGPPGGMSAGWHQYLETDLRALLGRRVRGRFGLSYCGKGNLPRCARDLWAAMNKGARQQAANQGADPRAWTRPVVAFGFTPLPLVTMQWTNRPSGIQQVLQFAP